MMLEADSPASALSFAAAMEPLAAPNTPAEEHALSCLAQPDSIMEKDVVRHLKTYIAQGGDARVRHAIDQLSFNYRGHGDMVNAMNEMLGVLGEDPSDSEAAIVSYLKDLSVNRFDPSKAEQLFSGSAPSWLGHMVTDPGWRSVLYKLSDKHSSCLLLTFAIQTISEQGLSTELATARLASVHFDVFRGVWQDHIQGLLDAESEPSFLNLLSAFTELCCQSEYAFLFTQQQLRVMAEESKDFGYVFRRLRQAVAEYAVSGANPNVAPKLHQVAIKLDALFPYPELLKTLASILRSGSRLYAGDIEALHSVYLSGNGSRTSSKPYYGTSTNSANSSTRPPLVHLQSPEVLRVMIRTMFDLHRPVREALNQTRLVELLALACSGGEDKRVLERVKESISFVSKLCQNKTFHTDTDLLGRLTPHLDIPVIGSALLYWMELILLDKTYHSASYHSVFTPIFQFLICDIAERHMLLRPDAIELLRRLILLETDLEPLQVSALQKSTLRCLTYLLQLGCVSQVCGIVSSNIASMDRALIRCFVMDVLSSISGPYSPEFVESFLQVLSSDTAGTAVRNNQEASAAVTRFLNHLSCNWSSEVVLGDQTYCYATNIPATRDQLLALLPAYT